MCQGVRMKCLYFRKITVSHFIVHCFCSSTKIDVKASFYVISKTYSREAWLARVTKAKSHHNHNRIEYKLNKHVPLYTTTWTRIVVHIISTKTPFTSWSNNFGLRREWGATGRLFKSVQKWTLFTHNYLRILCDCESNLTCVRPSVTTR